MSQFNPYPSKLWCNVLKTCITEEAIGNIENFKTTPVNYRLSMWNPQTNGLRYVKILLYNLASSLSMSSWQKIKNIKNRTFGNPITITYNGESVCMDYLQAVLELDFMDRNLKLDGLKVLEIGGGYGRTCHAILSNYNVQKFTMVDVGVCISLAKNYLKKVLDKECYSKIDFVDIQDFHKIHHSTFDLAITINSSEMDVKVLRFYLHFIDKNCRFFYTKNPVGKYFDKTLDNNAHGEKVVKLALKTGLIHDIIDVNNNKDILRQVPKFLKVYQPGNNWRCLLNEWSPPWNHFWQAMYQRN